MTKILQDIWILSETGITVFSRVYDPKINEQLFGALMSAINQFAEQISEGGISNFSLSNIHFSIIKSGGFLFVASSANKKEKKTNEELRKIADKFFKKYPDLESWDSSEVSIFSDFELEIEDSLKDTVDKLKKAFW